MTLHKPLSLRYSKGQQTRGQTNLSSEVFMNLSLVLRHAGLLSLTLATLVLAIGLSLLNGTPKAWSVITWLDVVGEGSVAVFAALWILAALASRPPGKVTTMLVTGLNCFLFSATLDLLDEFSSYFASAHWLTVVESIPAAFGMVIMSVALYYWHLEQLALNRQLQRREWDYREHDQIDEITQLYRADYWRSRAHECQRSGNNAYVVILDINNFGRFNARFGIEEGNRFLREIAHLITMNIRACDLACRYAGDRFVLLLPQLTDTQAQELCHQLCCSIRNVAFKCNSQTLAIFNSARAAASPLQPFHELDDVLARLNHQLDDQIRDVA